MMEGFQGFWFQADAIGRAVALLLLLMSIGAWVLIFWKGWVLRRAVSDLRRGVDAFWNAPDPSAARKAAAVPTPKRWTLTGHDPCEASGMSVSAR